jgi:hypothetical protein
LNSGLALHAQSIPIEKEESIVICKAIFSYEEFQDSTFYINYNTIPTLFVLNNARIDEEEVNISFHGKQISIWNIGNLFMKNIQYRFEITDYKKKKDKVRVFIKTVIPIGLSEKKPSVNGKFVIKIKRGEYRISKKRITIR